MNQNDMICRCVWSFKEEGGGLGSLSLCARGIGSVVSQIG